MKIEISDSKLSYLEGDVADVIDVPIRVIREARVKVNLMKAIPRLELMSKWKSLNFKQGANNNGCVLLEKGWQIDLLSIPNEKPQQIRVLALRRLQ